MLSFFDQDETQVFICSLSSSWFQVNCVVTEHLFLCVVMFEPMLQTISGWFSHVAESVTSLQEPKEPLQRQEFSKDDMEGLLCFLKLPLSYGHEELKHHWPHTPHEANLVIESLHNLPRALLFGAKKDDAIIASFLEKRGLSVLIEPLLAVSTPEIIRAQAWQSLSLILLNVKDCFVRHMGTHETHGHTFTHMNEMQMKCLLTYIACQSCLLLLPSSCQRRSWLGLAARPTSPIHMPTVTACSR